MLKEESVFDDLGTKVYNRIKHMIISGELKPGTKLVQEDLAKSLGVSRTPLLQAISRLTSDQLVESKTRRGAYVRHFSVDDKLQIFDIRSKLEPLSAREAAKLITEDQLQELQNIIVEMEKTVENNNIPFFCELDYDFHTIIQIASGNKFILEILSKYTPLIQSESRLKSLEASLLEHKEILKSLSFNESDRVSILMYNHVDGGLRTRLESLLKGEEDE
jgi:GntR family transcriptional regulator of vanillate catabolism